MNRDGKIPMRLQEAVDNELEAGESIKWIDMPKPHFFNSVSKGSFVFGIAWTTFTSFLCWAMLKFKIPEFGEFINISVILFFILFFMIGISLLLSPLFVYIKSLRTVYVISDKRAFIIEKAACSKIVRSYLPEKFDDIFRRDRRDGFGDIIIKLRVIKNSDGGFVLKEEGFFRIANAKLVEKALRDLASQESS